MTPDEMRDDFSERIGSTWSDAAGAGLDAEFIEEMVSVLVMAALSLGVDDYDTYIGDDTDAIEDTIIKKVHNLLLTEIAKVNGT